MFGRLTQRTQNDFRMLVRNRSENCCHSSMQFIGNCCNPFLVLENLPVCKPFNAQTSPIPVMTVFVFIVGKSPLRQFSTDCPTFIGLASRTRYFAVLICSTLVLNDSVLLVEKEDRRKDPTSNQAACSACASTFCPALGTVTVLTEKKIDWKTGPKDAYLASSSPCTKRMEIDESSGSYWGTVIDVRLRLMAALDHVLLCTNEKFRLWRSKICSNR